MDTIDVAILLPEIETIPNISWEVRPTARVLVTGTGSPAAYTVLDSLREYDYRLVGTDMNPQSYGRFHCDAFYTSLRGDHPNFANPMLDLISREKVDVVLPPITDELIAWSKLKGILDGINVPVLVTNRNAIEACLSKAETYKLAEKLNIPVLPWFASHGAIRKPVYGKGSRGLEIYDFPAHNDFSVFVKKGEGDETSVDALCKDGEILTCYARKRTRLRGGLHYSHEVIDAPLLVDYTKTLVEYLNYDWFINVQFIGGYLSEVNPRPSTIITWGEFNLPHLAVQLALGVLTPDDVKGINPLPIGLKSFYHHAQITYLEEQWPVGEL